MRVLLSIVIVASLLATGCKKKAKDTGPDPAGPPGPGSSSNSDAPKVSHAGGVGIVVSPGGGGGGGGAVQAVRKAARRTQALNELKNLGELIQFMHTENGKMPTKDEILAALAKDAPNIKKGIEEGSYILVDKPEPGGLWAYEVDAEKTPGIAVIGGRATRSTPDDLKPYFEKKN